MTKTVNGCIFKELTVANGTCSIAALKNTHLVAVSAIKIHNCADTGSPVGKIGLKCSCAERVLKGAALCYEIVDSVSLVAVGNDKRVTALSDRGVDDKGRVLDLALIVGVNGNVIAVFNKDSVARVFASAHYEISKNSIFAVGALAGDNTSADVGITLDCFTYRFCFVNVHLCILRKNLLFIKLK
jgi:hypothetical protein